MQHFLLRATLAVLCSVSFMVQANEPEMSTQERHDQLLANMSSVVEDHPLSIYMAYKNNEYAADAKYKGQWLNIKGYVGKVRPDYYTREPVVEVVSARGMFQSLILKLFPEQVISHDSSGYHTVPRQQIVENLIVKMPVMANCRIVGKSQMNQVVLDNCLVYHYSTYEKLYSAK